MEPSNKSETSKEREDRLLGRITKYLHDIPADRDVDDEMVAFCASLKPPSLLLARLAKELQRRRAEAPPKGDPCA